MKKLNPVQKTVIGALVFHTITKGEVPGKISAILKTVPSAVLGSIMLLLFGTIACAGVNTLIKNKVDFLPDGKHS